MFIGIEMIMIVQKSFTLCHRTIFRKREVLILSHSESLLPEALF